MRHTLAIIAAAATFAAPAYAASTAADILAANKAAAGGAAWNSKATLKAEYDYSGMGMTGKVWSVSDLRDGKFVDSAAVGPATQADGFDGTNGWAKDTSGTVTPQNGASRFLLVNEGYRDANMWWRPDFGDATVTTDPQKSEGGATYDVVTITPKDGGDFDAWFDSKTHLLFRIAEKQEAVVVNTTYTDYRNVDGVMLPGKQVQGRSDSKLVETQTLSTAMFLERQPDTFYATPHVTLTDFSIAAGAKETTFPFQLVNNHIYADVKVNGKGPYVFIFDTGGVNVVSPTLAKQLGLKVEGDLEARGSGSGSMQAGITKVARLDLGDASVSDQIFMSAPLDSMSNVEGMDMPGMVGFEVFRRFVTRIDYGAKTITLIDPKNFDPTNAGTPVAISFDGNVIEADGSYNGLPGRFIIDTGARSSLTLNSPFVTKNKLHDASVTSAEATTGWGVGGPTKSFVQHGGMLKIGSVEVKGPLTALSTSTAGSDAVEQLAGNIGGGVLKRFVATFDYEHTTMYLKPVAGAVADLDTFDRAGMWFNKDSEGFKIVDVTANTPASDAGLVKDDIITAVDGKPATGITLPAMRMRLRDEAPGTVVTLAVKGKSDVKVALRDLF
ncbi:MAG: aspartyl protease family protein [Rhizomicrobium sp.]